MKIGITQTFPQWVKIIYNPPYQEMYNGNSSGANSVYDKFLDASHEVADKVEMIHPARFLFNAGSTPKAWNEKMLNNPHFKILSYESNSDVIFPNLSAPIEGGVAISYWDKKKDFGIIGTFTPFAELNSILEKVRDNGKFSSFADIVVTSFAYHFTQKMHDDYPDAASLMSKGHAYDLKSNVFDRLSMIFHDDKPNDSHEYIQIFGRDGNNRTLKYIRKEYINKVSNLDKYKLLISKADGASGHIGKPIPARIIGKAEIVDRWVGSTETFLGIGSFETRDEAENCLKYIKTKFARTMLGVLKVTQDITPSKWKYVPLQDFTDHSDIDWSKSVAEIDRQLYLKYDLTADEIEFIETHVKEMA